jgi:Zn-dependent M32 family carboxypeptidase
MSIHLESKVDGLILLGNKEIEDLFDEELLKKQIANLFEKDSSKKDLSQEEKKKLKNSMAANKELKEKDYAGFKPLLEEILKLSNTKN